MNNPLQRERRSHNSRSVITGAGSGIGRALAMQLAASGGQVVCSDIDLDRADDTVGAITKSGGRAVAIACDVRDLDQVQALAKSAGDALDGPVDLVINNAGVGVGGLPVGELTMDDWRFTVDVNLWGVIHGCHVFTPGLRELGRGGIINLASAAAFTAAAGMASYNVTKAAVLSLSETMAAELAGTGVRVTVVCPTFVSTNITNDGRIHGEVSSVAERAMALTGRSAERIARSILSGYDAGDLYVVPQMEAKLLWRMKRHAPNAYLREAASPGRRSTDSQGEADPMSLDLDDTLTRIKERQWALADFDWDAPGAERISPEQWDTLKEFMADLVWIEHVGARGFKALAEKADDPTLAEIYRWFEAEEQRHANAELALMRRWGMVEEGEVPQSNTNIRLVIEWLDANAHTLSLGLLTTVIAILEVTLDGALVKFLLDEVEDPICHEVFARINNDESRHLAVDFHVMEQMGMRPPVRETVMFMGSLVKPQVLMGMLVYFPLLSRMRDNLVRMGLGEQRLYDALERFDEIGSRSPYTRRYAAFQTMRIHARMVINRDHPYHLLGDSLVAVTSRVPTRLLGPLPSWVRNLTSQPTA